MEDNGVKIYSYTQESYDLYDKKSLKSNIDRIYKYINRGVCPPYLLITKYLHIETTEDLKMIRMCYRFGRTFREYKTGISNQSFSFRIYVNKHGSVRVSRFRNEKVYFKIPKIIFRYQLIPLGKLRVRNFKGYNGRI